MPGKLDLKGDPEELIKLFAKYANNVAATTHGWDGSKLVFISDVWKSFQRTPLTSHLTRAQFDDLLLIAMRQGLVRLERADLVAAMDSEKVRKSEIKYLNATFHFVLRR